MGLGLHLHKLATERFFQLKTSLRAPLPPAEPMQNGLSRPNCQVFQRQKALGFFFAAVRIGALQLNSSVHCLGKQSSLCLGKQCRGKQ